MPRPAAPRARQRSRSGLPTMRAPRRAAAGLPALSGRSGPARLTPTGGTVGVQGLRWPVTDPGRCMVPRRCLCRGEASLARLHQKARHEPRVIAGPLGRMGRAYPTPTCGTRGRGMGVLTVLPRLCRAERQIGTGFAGPLGPDGSDTPDPAGQAPVTPTGGTGGTAAATVTGRRSRSAHRPLSCRGEACLAQPHRRRGILRSRCRLSRPDGSGAA